MELKQDSILWLHLQIYKLERKIILFSSDCQSFNDYSKYKVLLWLLMTGLHLKYSVQLSSFLPFHLQKKRIWEFPLWPLGLRIRHCLCRGVGSIPVLVQWLGVASVVAEATAVIWICSLAWELPYAVGRGKKENKERKKDTDRQSGKHSETGPSVYYNLIH